MYQRITDKQAGSTAYQRRTGKTCTRRSCPPYHHDNNYNNNDRQNHTGSCRDHRKTRCHNRKTRCHNSKTRSNDCKTRCYNGASDNRCSGRDNSSTGRDHRCTDNTGNPCPDNRSADDCTPCSRNNRCYNCRYINASVSSI